MWKLRVCVIAASSVFALATGTAAWGASGGDSNAGDVWLDNAGQPAGPGHEMDPHLGCGTINLYGSGLADGSGSFTIDGWPPSGSQEVVYTGSWSYSGSGTQTIASFDASTLVADASKTGDTASAQGYHFKLDFSQDPQKHKTFWVNCSPSSSSTTSSSSASSPSTGSPTTASSTAPTASVKATHKSRRRSHLKRSKRRRHLVRPARHHKAAHRSVSAVSETAPAFTG
jgi:hypothetical protein